MSQATRDFWPDDLAAVAVVTPVAVLREQAALLGEKTGGLVLGEVKSDATTDGLFIHQFFLTVPALGGYRYELLRVLHPLQIVPIELYFGPRGGNMAFSTVETFIDELKQLLQSRETANVIRTLVAQARE
jgi:hypothetical protein